MTRLLGFISRTTLAAYESSSRLEQLARQGRQRPEVPQFRPGPPPRADRPDHQGRLRHADLLHVARRLRHPRQPARNACGTVDRALRFDRRVPRRPRGRRPGRPGRPADLQRVRPPGRRKTRRSGPTTARPRRCSWSGPVAKPGLVGAHPKPRRPRRRRPEISHRLPPGLRLPSGRLARLSAAVDRRRRLPAAAPFAQGVTAHPPQSSRSRTSPWKCGSRPLYNETVEATKVPIITLAESLAAAPGGLLTGKTRARSG